MRFAALLLTLFVFAIVGWPQEAATEPEFADVFFRLDVGKLIPLERQTAVIQGKTSGFIVMSMKSALEFSGAKSPVRFTPGQPIDFVVRTLIASAAVDPRTLYVLRKLGTKKKSRELVIITQTSSFSSRGTTTRIRRRYT